MTENDDRKRFLSTPFCPPLLTSREQNMGSFPVARCIAIVLMIFIAGCQEHAPAVSPEEPVASETVSPSRDDESKGGKDATPSTAIEVRKTTRRLELRKPRDDHQQSRAVDLKIMWRGDPPSEARVFVNDAFVGRGRTGFELAVEALQRLPHRAKVVMDFKVPASLGVGGRNIGEIPDPFSVWPDLDAAFSKVMSEKEICTNHFVGWEYEEGR